ncbi:hypothetical protein DIPPA_10974 [Diplonema papillatum]|nr:hypothetical protein DIPPA_10974 [Diplonema papillatum]
MNPPDKRKHGKKKAKTSARERILSHEAEVDTRVALAMKRVSDDGLMLTCPRGHAWRSLLDRGALEQAFQESSPAGGSPASGAPRSGVAFVLECSQCTDGAFFCGWCMRRCRGGSRASVVAPDAHCVFGACKGGGNVDGHPAPVQKRSDEAGEASTEPGQLQEQRMSEAIVTDVGTRSHPEEEEASTEPGQLQGKRVNGAIMADVGTTSYPEEEEASTEPGQPGEGTTPHPEGSGKREGADPPTAECARKGSQASRQTSAADQGPPLPSVGGAASGRFEAWLLHVVEEVAAGQVRRVLSTENPYIAELACEQLAPALEGVPVDLLALHEEALFGGGSAADEPDAWEGFRREEVAAAAAASPLPTPDRGVDAFRAALAGLGPDADQPAVHLRRPGAGGVGPAPSTPERDPSAVVSPVTHGDHVSPATHGGHVSPATHGGHVSPATHGGHVAPATHGDHVSPATHGGHVSPATHGDHVSPVTHGDHVSRVAHDDQQQRQQDLRGSAEVVLNGAANGVLGAGLDASDPDGGGSFVAADCYVAWAKDDEVPFSPSEDVGYTGDGREVDARILSLLQLSSPVTETEERADTLDTPGLGLPVFPHFMQS